ncbi:MAG: hypothetical protein ACXABY_32635 [Candidatus Thorarchaeota archaeon]|jgi:hypothetical protein
MGVKLIDTVTAITTDQSGAPSSGIEGASTGLLLLIETTAIGSSTTQFEVSPEYVTAAGNALQLGATTTLTETGVKELALTGIWDNATTDREQIVPFPNQITYTLSSSGTTDTLSANIIMITPD